MISKSLFVSAVVLALGLQVNAEAGFLPALGVSIHAAFTINDVQRPTSELPCGSVDPTDQAVNTSTPVMIASSTSNITIIGASLGVANTSLLVSSWAVNGGDGFTEADVSKIIQNGNPNSVFFPNFSQFLVLRLPDNTVCNIDGCFCVLSLSTATGFGNCIVVQVGPRPPFSIKTDTRAVGTRAVRAYLEALTTETE